MAKVKGFRGIRFNTAKAGKIEQLVCPPYDIVSDEQRQSYIDRNENNIIRLELPVGGNMYENAAKLYEKMREDGVLIREEEPALYIYEESFECGGKNYSIKGVICAVKIEEFEKGVILPHEYTLSKAKEDRMELMKATNCNFSQVYSLYMDSEHKTTKKLDFLSIREADISLTDSEGVSHRLWIVRDKSQINSICADFDDRKLYIADGHHRYETALAYRNYCRENGLSKEGDSVDYQMMMLVDMEHTGLVVLPTHRIVRNLSVFNERTIGNVLKKCEIYFDVTRLENIDAVGATLTEEYKNGNISFAFYCGGTNCYLLRLKDRSIMKDILPNLSEASRELDVTVLHSLILEKIFGINKKNMEKQLNLVYTKKAEEAIESVRTGRSQCAFIMNPTRVTQIRDVAASGEKMPQKSTYFFPKLITGLVMNELS
ncbi:MULTISPECIES: DUF1015 domain-containing protein [unclassified Ruminococcus]|uniref:DUF1015 domain-containing protein n=1 Tax=unclassified Ruminococcus TaxID=2608920 RepID=UPI002108BC24|nr:MULTISPECIES: DUF1015 domain-containing protein [unclassified Ruminococcus]MCQ4022516.1 DUF1015 family protein [Ruminococcus sp. zg-924]MCQ4115141.1 DUF1015 family protein [Ruminococcus sp. zg-921]